jgi:nucleotide-binding universal stress UspA family protein
VFTRILFATDGSPSAEGAFRYARDLAARDHAHLVVVYAFPSVPPYLGEPWRERFREANVAEGQRVTSLAVEAAREAGLNIGLEILEGNAADVILRVAQEQHCDLIVMGSRGHRQLTDLLLGSVSQRVVANASVPVLIVKATPEGH